MSNIQLINDLKKLLFQEQSATQESLRLALQAKGYVLNQPKISRMLKRINAVKYKNETGEMVYCLPHDVAPPEMSASLSELILDIRHNETTIVIKTSPGAASLIARVIDNKKCKVLGSIAGDDTIFLSPISIKKIDEIMDLLSHFLNYV